MSVKKEVESYIYDNWRYEDVANWVINNLPLLEKGGLHPACPVFSVSLEEGLRSENDEARQTVSFSDSTKFVISGGFEGTKGHLMAVNEVDSSKVFRLSGGSPTVLLLEPDLYIREKKNREPLLDINQRSYLWSTSGLIDAVVHLPEMEKEEDVSTHYLKIHGQIEPAFWHSNLENPNWEEIIDRPHEDAWAMDLNRVFGHAPQLHASFLARTQEMDAKEAGQELISNTLEIIDKSYPNARFPDALMMVTIDLLTKGL